jgi:pullulanase
MNKKLRFAFALSFASLLSSCQNVAQSEESFSAVEGTSSSEEASQSISALSESSSLPSTDYGSSNIIVHFYGKGLDYSKYALWLWKDGTNQTEETLFSGIDSFGAYALMPISSFGVSDVKTLRMGTIVKSKGTWNGYKTIDMFAEMSLAPIDEKGNASIWVKHNDTEIYYSEPSKYSFSKLEFASLQSVRINADDAFSSLALYDGEKEMSSLTLTEEKAVYVWDLGADFSIDFGAAYYLEASFGESKEKLRKSVSFSSLYDKDEFNEKYAYDGLDLGANYSKERTLFKVWSPSAKKITVRLYSSGTPKKVSEEKGDDTYKEYEMKKGEKGVWRYSLEGDMQGKYYTYCVSSASLKEKEIIDPYAKSAGVNGIRGMIVDFSRTNPEGWDEVKVNEYDKKSLTVYETHVADLTSSATWQGKEANRKRYLGLAETGTSYSEGLSATPTGFDYIRSLGVNAIQLQPIFDQDNDEVNASFNWGYNPLNYNVLEGSYSSDPYDGYARIKEFKEVVKAYNNAGINIIMDVVYNHVSSVSGTSFDVLAPGYYFRYKSDGTLSSGSGCGNDTASERAMFASFMTQSVSFWASEYKLGGFRFDLMGLHPIKTMDKVTKALHEINPYIAVYGEPWTLTTSSSDPDLADQPGIKRHMDEAEDFSCFNDGFRDGMIKGGMKGASEVGFATCKSVYQISAADMNQVAGGIVGSTYGSSVIIADPDRTVNYVTCHDNYTLLDRFEALDKANKSIEFTDEEKQRMNVLANAITFTSLGTSFMQEGEEFLRSKGGESNSYGGQNDGRDYYRMNGLDYSLALKHSDMVEKYKTLIAFKQNCAGLHLGKEGAAKITVKRDASSKRNELIYDVEDGNGGSYRIAHVNGGSANPDPIDFSGYELTFDSLSSGIVCSDATPVSSYQTIIAHKA